MTKMPRLVYTFFAFISLILSACNTYDPDFNAPLLAARIPFTAERLYPEGIAYSPITGRFLVSSITRGIVGTVDELGHYTDLITDNLLIGANGLKVHDGKLYVCNGDQGVSARSSAATTLKTAGLFVYDLNSGKNLSRFNLASLLPDVNHFANDLAFDAKGNAYVTDSFAPVIYKIPADTTQPSIFVNNPQFSGTQGFNLNGIVYHPDNYLIVVKSNEGKLFKVPVSDPNTITEITGVTLLNGDGMVLYENDLYVVNGRNKVSQVRSTDNWKTATIIKTDSIGYDQATTNVLAENKIYVLNARISEVGAAAEAKNPNLLQANTYSIQQFK